MSCPRETGAGRRPRTWLVPAAAALAATAFASGCTDGGAPRETEFVPFAEATLAWAQSDSVKLHAWMPLEVKAESGTTAWIVDGATGGVMRFEPSAADYRAMGAFQNPPEEMVRPVKLAYSGEFGLFVYDLEAQEVQVYSPDGTPLRTFAPGFQPARMEITRRPIGLALARLRPDADSVPRLDVVRLDLRGEPADTLLHAGSHGPAPLWNVPARSDSLSIAPAEIGLWIYSRAVPDTVFELAARSAGRRIVLRPQDRDALGVLADLERNILWVVRADVPDDAGEEDEADAARRAIGYLYSAYDIGAGGSGAAGAAFLGERRSPPGFEPRAAADGIVIGWMPGNPYPNLAGFDMHLPAQVR